MFKLLSMKTKFIPFLIRCRFLFYTTICLAANPVPYTFDLQGLIPFEKYTDVQTRAKLGNNPLHMTTRFDGETTTRTYRYGTETKYNQIWFRSIHQDEFRGFKLVDSTLSLFEGRLKVGNNISKVAQLGGGLLEYKETNSENKKIYYFYPVGEISEEFLEMRTNLSGIIEQIYYEPPM